MEFLEARNALRVAIPELYKICENEGIAEDIKAFALNTLILALIGNGDFNKAIKLISQSGSKNIDDFDVSEAFNFSMARLWN